MMLYQITALDAVDMSGDIPLPRTPSRPKEQARNTNWDRHALYAEYVDPEPLTEKDRALRIHGMVSGSPALEWRAAKDLTPTGQRRHGVGPVIDAERARARERAVAKVRAEIASIPPISNKRTGYVLSVDAEGFICGEGSAEDIIAAWRSAPQAWRDRVVAARRALRTAEKSL